MLYELDDVYKSLGDKELIKDFTTRILQKDTIAIVGPNGSGKSTLLKLILGLLTPQNGTIINNIKTNQVGYVPQNTNLNIDFPITALEIVLMGHISSKKRLFGYSKEDIACAMASLAKVSMTDFANSKIGDLSGGQRQRVFIARALCSNPKIMLLDEPTASIDVKGQREIYELLKEINNSICVVVVSHDISVLLNYAKNVAHINKNLVYHSLENVEKNVNTQNEHLCEVELLSALGKSHVCCDHNH